jgi:hypothetical protein
MIENDTRQGNREKNLIAKLNKYTKDFRQSYDDGGPVKPKPPIDIDEYVALGLQIATMSKEQRENLQFMLDKLGPKKK